MKMLKQNPSILQRISASHKRFNSRETIAQLCNVIMSLDAENKMLSDTVNWMHDTIWEMMRAQRAQSGQAKAMEECSASEELDEQAPQEEEAVKAGGR